MRTRQMAVFLFLLAASWIIDYRRYAISRPTGTPEGLFLVGVVLLFGAACFHLGSMPVLLGAAALGLAALALDPHLSNHETLYVAVLLAILVTWCVAAVRERSVRVYVPRYDATLAGTLRLVFLASYLWAAFHKWNSDFLDPAKSCATHQIVEFQAKLPAVPVPAWVLEYGAPLTIAIELAIPILLVVPASRRVGLLLGLGFHTVLGIGFPAFQLLVFGFLLLFVPEPVWVDVFARARERAPALLRRAAGSVWVRTVAGLAFAVASTELYTLTRAKSHRTLFSQDVYAALLLLLLAAIALWCVARVLRSPAWREAAPVPLARGIPALLYLLPLAVLLQGLQPHLGIKGVQSFAMFSNLDTDSGQSNHWILPASLQVSSNLRDTVIVHDSSAPEIRALSSPQRLAQAVLRAGSPPPRLRAPYLELRREVTRLARAGTEGLMVDYSHGGRRRRVENAERDPDLANASLLERFYLKTRPLAIAHHGACRW